MTTMTIDMPVTCAICGCALPTPLDEFGAAAAPTCMVHWLAFGPIRVEAGTAHDYIKCPLCHGTACGCGHCAEAGWVRVNTLTPFDTDLALATLEEWEKESVIARRLAERAGVPLPWPWGVPLPWLWPRSRC